MSSIDWNGTDQRVIQAMGEYQGRVIQAVRQVAQYWQPVLERYAKDHAPWQDQTGNARQALHTWVETLAKDTVALYLAHGMDYGIYLETRFQGRYAVIAPTLEAHYRPIGDMLKGIFGR